jgi:hypothetical protein
VSVGFCAPVACPQESEVKDKGVKQGQRFDGETEIDPSDLVPISIRRQDRAEKTPRKISNDDEPNQDKH